MERTIRDVPDRLEGRAFIAEYVFDALRAGLSPTSRYEVAWSLSAQYVDSYIRDLDANILVDFPWATLDITADFGWRRISVRQLHNWLRHLGLQILLRDDVRIEDLVQVATSLEFDLVFEALFTNGSFERWMTIAELDRSPLTSSDAIASRAIDRLNRLINRLERSGIVA